MIQYESCIKYPAYCENSLWHSDSQPWCVTKSFQTLTLSFWYVNLDILDVSQIFHFQNVCRHLKKVESHCYDITFYQIKSMVIVFTLMRLIMYVYRNNDITGHEYWGLFFFTVFCITVKLLWSLIMVYWFGFPMFCIIRGHSNNTWHSRGGSTACHTYFFLLFETMFLKLICKWKV